MFVTEIILRYVRHLVYGNKTSQFPFSTLLLMAVGHPWHVCKLRSIFYMKSTVGLLFGDDQCWFYRSRNMIITPCYHFITYV